MPKELVVTALGNRIQYATTNGRGLITGKREDVTDEAVRAVFEYFMRDFNVKKSKGEVKEFVGISFEGLGSLKYFPPEDNQSE